MARVEPGPGGRVRLRLDGIEAQALRDLLEQLLSLLEHPGPDPVIDRLFPPAYEDPRDERAFRELAGSELERNRRTALATVRDRLDSSGPAEVHIPGEEVDAWLTSLTDLRLALGTRLEVTEELMEKPIEQTSDPAGMALIHWLGWIQEEMLRTITEGGRP